MMIYDEFLIHIDYAKDKFWFTLSTHATLRITSRESNIPARLCQIKSNYTNYEAKAVGLNGGNQWKQYTKHVFFFQNRLSGSGIALVIYPCRRGP